MQGRPFDLGCQPKEAKLVTDTCLLHPDGLRDFFNIIVTERPLTKVEVRNFELYDFEQERYRVETLFRAAVESQRVFPQLSNHEALRQVKADEIEIIRASMTAYSINQVIKEVYADFLK